MNLTIVMYHYVRDIQDSAYPGIRGLEFKGFQRQLDHLTRRFNVVTVDQIVGHLSHGARLPDNPCWLTFDDGYKDHYRYVLPELAKRHLQGSFFAPARPILDGELLDVNAIHHILACAGDTAQLVQDLKVACFEHGVSQEAFQALWEEIAIAGRYDPKEIVFFKRALQRELPEEMRHTVTRELFQRYVGYSEAEFATQLYMSLDEVRELTSAGMYVGNHSYNHRWLNALPADQQAIEIDKSLDFLAMAGTPTRDWVMCYPYGGYNQDTLDILKARQCAIGLTTKVGIADLALDNPLELRRFDTNDFPQ